MDNIPKIKIFTAGLLVTGMTIGAGILALPIKTGLAGVLPSLLSIVLVWLLMISAGTILIYKFTHPPDNAPDFPALFQQELGAIGKWMSIVGYLIIFYGLLVAYLTGAAAILVTLVPLHLPRPVWMLIFFVLLTSATLFGMDRARKWNAAIMIVLFASFLALLVGVGEHVDVKRFSYTDWRFIPSILPIIIVAFCFQNVIPAICRNLNYHGKAAWNAMVLGSFIALLMNIVWMLVVVGALPLAGSGEGNLLSALHMNRPATIPLSIALHSKWITVIGMFFAIAAISTSYIATGVALKGFMGGLLRLHFRKSNKILESALAFGPPILVGILFPHVFLKAIDIVGGVGVILVFGILPSLILLKIARSGPRVLRIAGYVLIVVFIALLACEIAQETGMLKLHPAVEHWKVSYK